MVGTTILKNNLGLILHKLHKLKHTLDKTTHIEHKLDKTTHIGAHIRCTH